MPKYNKHNREISQHYLDMLAVSTSREYKDKWRKKLAFLKEAVNQFDFCSASLPWPESFHSINKLNQAIEELEDALSVKNWGR